MPLHVPVPLASHPRPCGRLGAPLDSSHLRVAADIPIRYSWSHYPAPCCSSSRLFDSCLLFSHLESSWPLGMSV